MTTTVLFCDICNESVPQSDVDVGRARVIKGGRVVCSVCDRSMSGEDESVARLGFPAAQPGPGASPAVHAALSAAQPTGQAPPADGLRSRPRRDGGSLIGASLALLAVLVAVGVGLKLSWDIDESRVSYDQSLRAAIRDYRTEALGVRQTSQALRIENERFLASLNQELQRFGRELTGADDRWKGENKLVLAELADFDAELTEIRDVIGLIERHDKEMIGLQAKFATLLDDVTKHTVRIASLEERPVLTIQEPVATDGGNPGGARTGAVAGDQPAWAKLLNGLDSPNADERWMAVDELGQTGDIEVAGPLVRMLQDEDTFVRMATRAHPRRPRGADRDSGPDRFARRRRAGRARGRDGGLAGDHRSHL